MQTRIAILITPGRSAEPENRDPKEEIGIAPPGTTLLKDSPDADAHETVTRLSGRFLREAAQRARGVHATHLMVLRRWSITLRSDIRKLAAACRKNPHALVLGRRPAHANHDLVVRWREVRLPRFWLKMQTGRALEDPSCALRVYPLSVIENVRLYQQGAILNAEILVKSAWADVPFAEVDVNTDQSIWSGEDSPFWTPVWRLALDIHYTLRSVLPVPHRKLITPKSTAKKPVSVWRPMRSLRTLLRENTSPGQLALAAAMGVFFGTLPLIALHSLVIMLSATYFRLNKVAALSASQLCMPPVVPALCIEIGHLLRHGRFLTEISLETIGYQALDRLYEWLLGSLILAPFLAFLVGGVTLLLARLARRSMATVRNLKPTPGSDTGA